MQKKISIIITLFFICILASWFIQRQAALYDVPVIEIERVRIEEDQQLITGRLMNTDQKGEVISLSAPYQKKSNRNSKYNNKTNLSCPNAWR